MGSSEETRAVSSPRRLADILKDPMGKLTIPVEGHRQDDWATLALNEHYYRRAAAEAKA